MHAIDINPKQKEFLEWIIDSDSNSELITVEEKQLITNTVLYEWYLNIHSDELNEIRDRYLPLWIWYKKI